MWKGFIGDPGFFFSSHANANPGSEGGDRVWKGDEMVINNKNGTTMVQYDDETSGQKGCIIC